MFYRVMHGEELNGGNVVFCCWCLMLSRQTLSERSTQVPGVLTAGMTAMPPSKETEIMGAMERLQEKKGEWVQVSTDARADMLAECLKRVPDIAKQAAAAAVRHHGSYGGGLGDEL